MVGVIHCKLATLIHLCVFFSLKHVRRMLGEGECENCELEKEQCLRLIANVQAVEQ